VDYTKPVRPAAEGTFALGLPGARYTAGAEFVGQALAGALRESGGDLAVDIETFGVAELATKIKCVTMASEHHAVVFDPRDPAQAAHIRQAVAVARHLDFHNSVFDVPNMHSNGLLELRHLPKVRDTLIWARLAEPDNLVRKSLGDCGKRYLGVADSPMAASFKAAGMTKDAGYLRFDLDRPSYLQGAAGDAILTARLVGPARRAALGRTTTGHPFTRWGLTGTAAERLVDREQQINRMMLRRACRGLRVDFEFLDQFNDQNAQDQARREALLKDAGIRPGIGPDLVRKLIELGAVNEDDWPKTKGGALSSAAPHLEKLGHPLARDFVLHKQLEKISKDYLSKMRDLADEHGRIHPVLNLLGATHGRASMGNPPVQQFPAGARGMILADDGEELTSIDWGSIEPVVAAALAREDPDLLRSYETDPDPDFYAAVTTAGGISRKKAKVTLLAQLYGEGITKLAGDLGIPEDEARGLKDVVFQCMPAVARMCGQLRKIGKAHRKVFTASGRILDVPMGLWNGEWSVATHKAINYTCCGSAYDQLAETLVRIDDAGLADAVYLTMHDEIVCATSAAADIRAIMERPMDRLVELAGRVPVLRTDRHDLGKRWAYV
jgi:DNA polymerase-1